MKTPLMIDTMNKRCYDIIPPTAKKMEVLYAPNLNLAFDPSLPSKLLLIYGDTSITDKIYVTSIPPTPLSELDKYNSITQVQVRNALPNSYYVIDNEIYNAMFFLLQPNIYPSTNVIVQLYISILRDGSGESNILTTTYDVGFTSAPNVLGISSGGNITVFTYNGKLYAVANINIYAPNSINVIPAFIIGELDIDNLTILSPRMYSGKIIGIMNGNIYVINSVGGSNTVYVYGLDSSTGEIYGVTTLDIQAPTGYTVLGFNGEKACIGGARLNCTCNLVEDELICYDDGVSNFQFKYRELYAVVRVLPNNEYIYGIVYNNILYGALYIPPTITATPLPAIMLYSGDLIVLWGNGVYIYMPELMPWDKCCDIPSAYSTCLYSSPNAQPIVENIQEIRIPVSDTGVAPPVTEYQLVGTTSSTSTTPVTEATVTIDHVC